MVNSPIVNTTICAISTPFGSGGIAVVRVSGESAIRIVDGLFRGRKSLNDAKAYTVHYGEIVKEQEVLDQVLVSVFRAPHSFTGEEVGEVANQDLHATESTDYVIIVPANGKLIAQAERLAEAHRQRRGLTVKVVRADEVYNEFSSGTPDATAYRRYMKMLYDRAATIEEAPKYLLLFGDGAWDNRMLTSAWKDASPDDYLLCYEVENSYSTTSSHVVEDYFGLLDDGEGANLKKDKVDIGVGRFPVTMVSQAREVVDKLIAYMDNAEAGVWKNTVLMLGDDGDDNRHMQDAESVAQMIEDVYQDNPRVKCLSYSTLTGDFAQSAGAEAIIRGVRNTIDFEYERTMAQTNKRLYPTLTTIVLLTPPELADVSSSTVRELLKFGRDVSEFMPLGIDLHKYLK